MDKEAKRALCMTLAASLFVLLACCWALISGNATVNCRGFAVDADGNYYIGLRQRPICNRGLIGRHCQCCSLIFCVLNHMNH